MNVCPGCSGRMKVYCVKKSAAGIITRYRECGCGIRTVDRERISVMPIGKQRVTRKAYYPGPDPANPDASPIPLSGIPG